VVGELRLKTEELGGEVRLVVVVEGVGFGGEAEKSNKSAIAPPPEVVVDVGAAAAGLPRSKPNPPDVDDEELKPRDCVCAGAAVGREGCEKNPPPEEMVEG
jgi:hypothetical protein